jgi:hypothetical protein
VITDLLIAAVGAEIGVVYYLQRKDQLWWREVLVPWMVRIHNDLQGKH